MNDKGTGGSTHGSAGGRSFSAPQKGLPPCCRAFSQSPDVAWILDYDTLCFTWVSPQSERVLGYTPDEAIGVPITELLAPAAVERVRDMIASRLCEFGQRLENGSPEVDPYFTDTFPMVHRDGSTVWIEISSSLYRDAGGQVYAAGVARDVTERHVALLALRDSEEMYRTAIQHSVTGLVVLSLDGTVLEVSQPFCSMMSCEPFRLRATKFDGHLDPVNVPVFGELLQQVLRGERDAFRMRLRFRRHDGSFWWGDSSAVAVRRSNGFPRYIIVRVIDISAQARAEDELMRVSKRWVIERERLRHTLDSIRDPIALLEAVRGEDGEIVDFRLLDINRASEQSSGLPREQVTGMLVSEAFPAIHHSHIQDHYLRAIETQEPVTVANVVWRPGDETPGRVRHFDIGIVPYGDTITATWRDNTEQYLYEQALAASEERYRLLTANLAGVVVKVRPDDAVDWVSPSLEESLGWSPEDWVGRPVTDFFHPDDLAIREAVAREARLGRTQSARWRVADKQGHYHWAQFMARPYLDAAGERDGMVGTFRLIDTEVAYEQELERRARYDDLSGLLNRRSILDRVAGVVGNDRRHEGAMSAVLFCDIDMLKDVNDTYGHAGGDALIVACAHRMVLAVRETDSVGRIGGDEFLILLDGLNGVDDAMAVAEKVRTSVHGEVTLRDGAALFPTVSVGVALAQPGEGVSALVERANAGLYDAKRAGRDRVILIPDRLDGSD